MRFRVRHTTTYRYSRPVLLGPHCIRLQPRHDGFQKLDRYHLDIYPAPAGRADGPGLTGFVETHLWFQQPTEVLTLVSSFEARTPDRNPFEFVVTEPDALRLPAAYATGRGLLAPYRRLRRPVAQVSALSLRLAREYDHQTLAFLTAACRHIGEFAPMVREEGAPMSPVETLRAAAGSCRDLTVLFIDLCRVQHLAARFVSGYFRGDDPDARRYLHAWAEVYLPGAGWRGYDPSLGLAVGSDHVAVAASDDPQETLPVTGGFSGERAEARMEWDLNISVTPGL